MATRIENSRKPKRVQAVVTSNTGVLTVVSGKAPRLDQRGFPTSLGVDTTRASYTDVTP